jgi:hypothetical protein
VSKDARRANLAAMNPAQRPAVAAIAASLVNRERCYRVYDHAAGRYLEVRVEVPEDGVVAFDFARRVHMRGQSGDVYDYGTEAYLQFRVDGATVKGYDCKSGCHFQASVSGKQVQLFDHEAGAYFTFQAG